MPKRKEKTKDVPCSWILTAGSQLREVALPIFGHSALAPLASKRWLLICCAKAALLPCKGRGVGTRSLVQGSQIDSGSSIHQICIPEWQGCHTDFLHRLLGEAGLASGHWRVVLGLHCQVLTSWLYTEHCTPYSFLGCCVELHCSIFIKVTEICKNFGSCQFIAI